MQEVSGSVFYSTPINFHEALIKALTFSRRPEGPRCLAYQNVPKLRSFWPIGKPWERFQSWDTRIYFLTVPDDYTVSLMYSFHLTKWKINGNLQRTKAHCSRHPRGPYWYSPYPLKDEDLNQRNIPSVTILVISKFDRKENGKVQFMGPDPFHHFFHHIFDPILLQEKCFAKPSLQEKTKHRIPANEIRWQFNRAEMTRWAHIFLPKTYSWADRFLGKRAR